MNIKNLLSSFAIATLAMTTISANAGNITANAARNAANNFLKQKMLKSPGSFNAAATADLRLVHAEPSAVVAGANDFYAFNIKGGGFVIIAGEDRAAQVLGYSDKGRLDFNNLPLPLIDLLDGYKREIEFLQTYEGNDLIPAPASFKASGTVGPLIKTTWGQEDPYDWQCPVYQGEYCVVGCVATAMAQVLKYWEYPTSCSSLRSFSSSSTYQTIPALPATTFDYSLMLDNYYTHNPETGNPTGYVAFTEEQANEVAKLCRYCGQACKARYGNANETSTGSYTYDQRDAFLRFGYSENMQLIGKDPSYYCSNSNKYSIEEWCDLINIELQAGRPIPYHDLYEGHAWVLDGVDADGKFHMNWGFNGRFNGWFEINALVFHPYGDDEVWDFSQGSNGGNEMIIGMYPYDGYVIPSDEPTSIRGDVNKDKAVNIADVTALIDYLLSNDATNIDLEAANCNQDDAVNISDVTALIDYLLSQSW